MLTLLVLAAIAIGIYYIVIKPARNKSNEPGADHFDTY